MLNQIPEVLFRKNTLFSLQPHLCRSSQLLVLPGWVKDSKGADASQELPRHFGFWNLHVPTKVSMWVNLRYMSLIPWPHKNQTNSGVVGHLQEVREAMRGKIWINMLNAEVTYYRWWNDSNPGTRIIYDTWKRPRKQKDTNQGDSRRLLSTLYVLTLLWRKTSTLNVLCTMYYVRSSTLNVLCTDPYCDGGELLSTFSVLILTVTE